MNSFFSFFPSRKKDEMKVLQALKQAEMFFPLLQLGATMLFMWIFVGPYPAIAVKIAVFIGSALRLFLHSLFVV